MLHVLKSWFLVTKELNKPQNSVMAKHQPAGVDEKKQSCVMAQASTLWLSEGEYLMML